MWMVQREDSLVVPLQEKVPILQEDLKFFKEFFSNQPEKMEHGEVFLTHVKSVAKEVVSFIYSINDNKMTEEMIMRTNIALHLLLLKTKLLKAEVILVDMKNLKARVPIVEPGISCTCILSALARWSSQFFHLKGPSHGRGDSVILNENQIDALLEGLRFLRKFIMEMPDIEANAEDEKLFLTHIMAVASESSSLIFSFGASDMADDVVSELEIVLEKLLQHINLIKAEKILMDRKNHELGLTLDMKNEFENLHEGLKFVRIFLMDQSKEDKKYGKQICAQSEDIAKETACLICSLFDSVMNEETANEMKLLLPDVLEKIELVKFEIKKIYLPPSHSSQLHMPKTDDLGIVNLFLGNLRDLLNRKVNAVAPVKHHIKMALEELQFLKSFLNDVAEYRCEHDEVRNLWTRIVHIFYEAEYVIDSFVLRDKPLWYRILWLSDIMEEIKVMKTKVMEIYKEKNHGTKVHRISKTSNHVATQVNSPAMDQVVIGVTDEAAKIIDRLTRGKELLDVVSIVGMAGIGKTTLARKVYNHPSVTHRFHVRAWCCVSQVYQRKDLLLNILSDVIELTDQIRNTSDGGIAHKLYQCLKGQRYLIVLDDLWDTEAWDELKWSFPNDNNSSRILLTSRLGDVALKAKSGSYLHHLRPLSDDESWELLKVKLFQKDDCPSVLVGFGKKIANNCKGLPLAVVVIAGILAKMEMNLDMWKKVAESTSSHIVGDPQRKCMHILELSYKHLPDYLKSCFLYFGAFPGYKEVPVRKLKWLWVAEGLLPNTQSKSLEETAEDCLLDLIDRNLVIVSKRRSDGGVKTCCVHDLLRDLCLEKGKEENFFQLINGYDEFFANSRDDFHSVIDPDHSCPLNPVIYKQRRVCISSKRKHFTSLRPCGPRVHTLLFFPSTEMNPRFQYDISLIPDKSVVQYDISFVPDNFKHLRVLDSGSINMGYSFPAGLELLVCLRYLSVKGDIISIPSSISNLWNLETLLVKGLRGEIVLPPAVWNMKRLRHLHVNERASFCLQDKKLDNLSLPDYVETLSSPVLKGEDAEKIMGRFHGLRKLGCIFVESWAELEQCNMFPRLGFLTSLESLKIFYYGEIRYPCKFDFPLNLKKLTLSKFRLPWNDISTIGRLPNLEVLKLLFRSFEGHTWDMREGEFLKLKFLKLEGLNVVQLNASDDPFPCLERLVLQRCKELQGIPSSFSDILTLQMIEVQWCTDSAARSVRRIEEEQRGLGNEGLKILIYP